MPKVSAPRRGHRRPGAVGGGSSSATARSTGKKLGFRGADVTVEETTENGPSAPS